MAYNRAKVTNIRRGLGKPYLVTLRYKSLRYTRETWARSAQGAIVRTLWFLGLSLKAFADKNFKVKVNPLQAPDEPWIFQQFSWEELFDIENSKKLSQ